MGYQYISECHPPFFAQGYGHHYGDGKSFPHRHQAIEHFRREYVYHWNHVSVPNQVHSDPHTQLPFDSWSKMHQHVMSEHNGYGFFYTEPDYMAIEFADDEDQLTLLPCTICNEFYHDQVSLDKHVANDHEPFATRRPFNDQAVKFDIPNIQHAAIRSIPIPIDLILPTPPPSIIKKKRKSPIAKEGKKLGRPPKTAKEPT